MFLRFGDNNGNVTVKSCVFLQSRTQSLAVLNCFFTKKLLDTGYFGVQNWYSKVLTCIVLLLNNVVVLCISIYISPESSVHCCMLSRDILHNLKSPYR